MNPCAATNRHGHPCRRRARLDSLWCRWHEPEFYEIIGGPWDAQGFPFRPERVLHMAFDFDREEVPIAARWRGDVEGGERVRGVYMRDDARRSWWWRRADSSPVEASDQPSLLKRPEQ